MMRDFLWLFQFRFCSNLFIE
uniref:Uncharacterized protein n=1 Tax=Arundo donax TaxID=35708 RepID=A0A0A9FAG7_ARUDO